MYPKGGNHGPNKDRKIHRRLQKKYPQEMKRIMKLREEDPRAFSSELQKLNRRDQAETK